MPHGRELNAWIAARAKHYGGIFEPAAVAALAVRLGRDEAKETKFGGKVVEVAEAYNLWQADSEIKKLLAFANGRPVTAAEVGELVTPTFETDVFAIMNAIADRQKNQALESITRFLGEENAADEKGKIIQLNALLSEQFRNVAVVQDLVEQRAADGEILSQTGWKSGRLYIIKKIATKFTAKTVLDLLGKLEALDLELKTSQTPPRVLLDLILAQLL